MTAERAIARLLRADGQPVGLAFLTRPRYLITCAHVVNLALRRPVRTSEPPDRATVWLEFPFGGGRDDHVRVRATVASWLANREASNATMSLYFRSMKTCQRGYKFWLSLTLIT